MSTLYRLRALLNRLGGVSFLCGAAIATAFIGRLSLPGSPGGAGNYISDELFGPALLPFLAYYLIAAVAFLTAAARLEKDRLPLENLWAFALLFRILLLLRPGGLSTDIYRYAWDGHLLLLGINPYAYPVDSPTLNVFDIPLRALVDHAWMASPYLPTAQLIFAAASMLPAPPLIALQLGAAAFDLGTGWLVVSLLASLGLPRRNALLYLWNPLVCLELSGGAHIDAAMLFFSLAAFWLLARANSTNGKLPALASAAALALATLTKGLPALLAPLFLRRWKIAGVTLYLGVILAASVLFAAGAGWGLSGLLDGRGLFGAVRIYMSYWNFNSSLYHWLEAWLSGYHTPGGVPYEPSHISAILLARSITTAFQLLAAFIGGAWAWRLDRQAVTPGQRTLGLVRLATLPAGAYLMLTHTVHPWYVTFIVPFLPFLLPATGAGQPTPGRLGRFVWPWLYLCCSVLASYLTYLDPHNLREFDSIRLLIYGPFYLLLLWAVGPWAAGLVAGVCNRISPRRSGKARS